MKSMVRGVVAMCLLGAVTPVGCGGKVGPEWSGCLAPLKCTGEKPDPNAPSTKFCEQWLADPKCGPVYRAWRECNYELISCDSLDTTDAGAAVDAGPAVVRCPEQLKALEACPPTFPDGGQRPP